MPPGVINVVTTQANVAEVGREMCENTAVKKVSFTGSTPVAKMLYGMAASTLKKCVVVLSADSPDAECLFLCLPESPSRLEGMRRSSSSMTPTSMLQLRVRPRSGGMLVSR